MTNKLYTKVFGWLFVGLLITFLTGIFISNSKLITALLFHNSLYILFFLAEIIIAITLSTRIYKMKGTTAKILYIVYAVLTGITFASIFLIYEVRSIIFVFLISAIIFGIFALVGKKIKIDLSKFSTFLFMTLIGVIILEFINLILMNGTLNIVLCAVSLFIFMGYVAFDIQKIGQLSQYGVDDDNVAIIGAFQLYLDFINIFIKLLRLFGKRDD